MFILEVNKNQLTVRQREPVTSGSRNTYQVSFQFSPEWEGLTKWAVFRAGNGKPKIAPWTQDGVCSIPWEAMVRPNLPLMAGVYGTRGGEVTLPTVWAGLGVIQEGAAQGTETQPPTPERWELELAAKGDKLSRTETGELGLYAGDKLLSSVPVPGSGEGGALDHRLLSGRDEEGQHPIGAITSLEKELSRRVSADDALSVAEIIKIMEG